MTPARRGYLDLCPAEPFRIFFPLATLIGISGVSLWPLFFSGLHKFYPGVMHARMMIEGFLAGFALGFLGTALPRLLGAPPLRHRELWPLVAVYLLGTGLHIGHQTQAGDAAFVVLLLGFGACMAARLRRGADLPPPGFVLVAFGYLSGLASPVLWLAGTRGWLPGRSAMLGTVLLHQGFVLYLLLGIGTFLLPRFLGVRGPRPMDETVTASPAWRWRAAFAGATGLVLFASFWIEAGNPIAPAAAWLRAAAVIAFLATMIPFHRQAPGWRTLKLASQAAVLALIVGLIFPLAWPAQRIAGLHVIFLGGFSLITFTVATRVVLGHSGNESRFEERLPFLEAAAALLLVGTVLRAVGDFLPTRTGWLDAASYLWMLAAAVWSRSVLPEVRVPDPAEAEG